MNTSSSQLSRETSRESNFQRPVLNQLSKEREFQFIRKTSLNYQQQLQQQNSSYIRSERLSRKSSGNSLAGNSSLGFGAFDFSNFQTLNECSRSQNSSIGGSRMNMNMESFNEIFHQKLKRQESIGPGSIAGSQMAGDMSVYSHAASVKSKTSMKSSMSAASYMSTSSTRYLMKTRDKRPFVLVLGLGNTGALTLRTIFNKYLRIGPTYSMQECITGNGRKHQEKWCLAHKDPFSNQVDYKQLFRGYYCSVDLPASKCYRGILKTYPDAKVIVTTVTNPVIWSKNAAETFSLNKRLFNTLPGKCVSKFLYFFIGQTSAFSRFMEVMSEFYGNSCWNSSINSIDSKKLETFYHEWENKIKTDIPADQVLYWNIETDGWGPLCQFLEQPIPENPIPRINETEKIRKFHSRMKMVIYVLFLIFWVVMLLVVFKFVSAILDKD